MKRSRISFLVACLSLAVVMVSCGPDVALPKGGVEGLIPMPQSVAMGSGDLECHGSLHVIWPEDWEAEQDVVSRWLENAGIAMDPQSPSTIRFSRTEDVEGAEAYRLNVESRGVVVEAATGAGLFRALIYVIHPHICNTPSYM